MRLEFGPTPMRVFTLRGTFAPNGQVQPGAAMYGEIDCRTMPYYGPLLQAIGLCNSQDVLAASGTFLSRAYDGPAGRPVPGLSLAGVQIAGGAVSARITGASLAGHAVSIAVVDPATGQPVALDEQARTVSGDTVTVPIPAGAAVPDHPRVHVIVDGYAFPARDL